MSARPRVKLWLARKDLLVLHDQVDMKVEVLIPNLGSSQML
jgi:hypothetical protein